MDDKATTWQRRMFFGLAHKLGYESELVKERAKKKYKLTTFKDISKSQISKLIDLLLQKQHEKS